MNSIIQIDQALLVALNGLAGCWPWLDALARLFLNDYFVPTLLAVALLALWFEDPGRIGPIRNRRAVLVAALSAALANSLLKLLNRLYYRPRPFADFEVTLLFYRPTDSSFPSNAATLGFAIAGGVWFYNRSWGWAMLAIAAIFGLSRIIGGVHFPLDVIAGAGLGWGAAWLVHQQVWIDRLLGLMVAIAGRLGLT